MFFLRFSLTKVEACKSFQFTESSIELKKEIYYTLLDLLTGYLDSVVPSRI